MCKQNHVNYALDINLYQIILKTQKWSEDGFVKDVKYRHFSAYGSIIPYFTGWLHPFPMVSSLLALIRPGRPDFATSPWPQEMGAKMVAPCDTPMLDGFRENPKEDWWLGATPMNWNLMEYGNSQNSRNKFMILHWIMSSFFACFQTGICSDLPIIVHDYRIKLKTTHLGMVYRNYPWWWLQDDSSLLYHVIPTSQRALHGWQPKVRFPFSLPAPHFQASLRRQWGNRRRCHVVSVDMSDVMLYVVCTWRVICICWILKCI